MKGMKGMKRMKKSFLGKSVLFRKSSFFKKNSLFKKLFFMVFSIFICFMSLDWPLAQTAAREDVVRLETPFGMIDLAIDAARAPITSANFLKYVDGGFYDGGGFHRVTRPDNYTPAPPDRPAMEIIQARINPGRRSESFPAIALERTSVTGLKHVAGVVSMARGTTADTASSDFFILLDDQPSLDFGGKRFEQGQGGAAFGRVIAGMDVVRKIQQQGPLQDPPRQQYLVTPVPITKASRK